MSEELKYPEVLNTKEDYEFVMKNFPQETWFDDVEELLMTAWERKCLGRFIDITDAKQIAGFDVEEYNQLRFDRDQTITNEEIDEATPVGNCEDDNDVVEFKGKFYKIGLVTNPEGKIFKLGYTEDQLSDILFGSPEERAKQFEESLRCIDFEKTFFGTDGTESSGGSESSDNTPANN